MPKYSHCDKINKQYCSLHPSLLELSKSSNWEQKLNMPPLLQKLFKRIIVNRGRNFLDIQTENRFRNYSVFCAAGLPIMLFFALSNMLAGKTLFAIIIILCFTGLAIGWLMLYRCVQGTTVFRLNALLFCSLLLYMAYIGGADGSKILWIYIFPLIAFFLLGNTEGGIWCTFLFLSCQLFLWNPFSFNLPHIYPAEFSLGFCLSFVTIAIITYIFERFRHAYRIELENKNQLLEVEIKNRKKAELALRKSEEQYRALFFQASEGIIVLDKSGGIIEVNPQIKNILSPLNDDLLGKNIFDFVHPDDLKETPSQIPNMISGNNITIERRLKKHSGEYLIFELSGRMVEGNRILLLCRDITKRKAAEIALAQANKKLNYLANIDGLTKIPNRRKFDSTFNLEWKRMKRENDPLTLVICDIDYFKQFNDLYGHQEGDSCLITVARILEESLHRPADMVARFGGEEFVLLLPKTSLAGGVKIAESIRKKIANQRIPHKNSTIAPFLTMSFGVSSLQPDAPQRPESLLAMADKALYQAKQNGRNKVEKQN